MKIVFKKFLPFLALVFASTLLSCEEPEPVIILSSDKQIESIFTEINGVVYQGGIDEVNKTVEFTLPYYYRTILGTLSFSYRFVGQAIEPDLNQMADYSTPTTVTITADDGTTVNYTLSVNLLPDYSLERSLEQTVYSQSDSVRVKGENLGFTKGVALIVLNDLNSRDPLTGRIMITQNILSPTVRLNGNELVFPLNTLPVSRYDISIKFPDRDEAIKMQDVIEVK